MTDPVPPNQGMPDPVQPNPVGTPTNIMVIAFVHTPGGKKGINIRSRTTNPWGTSIVSLSYREGLKFTNGPAELSEQSRQISLYFRDYFSLPYGDNVQFRIIDQHFQTKEFTARFIPDSTVVHICGTFLRIGMYFYLRGYFSFAALMDAFYPTRCLKSVSVLYGTVSHSVSLCYWQVGCGGLWEGPLGKLSACFIRAKKIDVDQAV